jgi:hypothetical protein
MRDGHVVPAEVREHAVVMALRIRSKCRKPVLRGGYRDKAGVNVEILKVAAFRRDAA